MPNGGKEMPDVVVWGAGNRCRTVIDAIRKDKCNLKGIADSDKGKHQKHYMGQWVIDFPEKLIDKTTDYVIIAPFLSKTILKQCREQGISDDKIINYWDSETEYEFIDANVKKIYELENELHRLKIRLENMPYELGMKQTPIIYSAEKLLNKIIKEKRSLSRFGDGELEIMQNRERPWFQETDIKLSQRLNEVFCSEDERIIIALANNFGSLDCYTEEAADGIRQYLSNGIREKLMQTIDINRIYYDAYITRPYMIYKDKCYAQYIFDLFKMIWKDRDILIVEGRYAHNGVGNDLFNDANSVRRIIAPAKNAFSVYNEIILETEKHLNKNMLVLISLGPTATVLAYDLAVKGIQAIDIGQLDNEYEWYLRGADERIEIPGKCVAESYAYRIPVELTDESYESQIVSRIAGDMV